MRSESGVLKLRASLLVVEALVLIRERKKERFPVIENDQIIGMINYDDLISFLSKKKDLFYYHQMNFELKIALFKIREKENSG
ncbi:CBS domain-containing protein [Pedobacter gandavensis]|uniref:CBS domain-containing protein n=1 Tax=Pedobacter gandavensis TaxID=2679963 RepID=UPI0029313392|nr:CBS domain-containing protein [Pedobacter gandavensis]